MSFSIITAEKFKTINWSGGTSTQLYIYPEAADYGLRNFDYRISTAKVEIEKSDFTPLPSVSRKIMILDGEIEISHKNQYTKTLRQFETDEFKGDWETSSIGTCVDFNLMTRGKTKSQLNSFNLSKDQTIDFMTSNQYSKVIIYLYSGKIIFRVKEKEVIFNQSELLIIDNEFENNLSFYALENSNMIVSKVNL